MMCQRGNLRATRLSCSTFIRVSLSEIGGYGCWCSHISTPYSEYDPVLITVQSNLYGTYMCIADQQLQFPLLCRQHDIAILKTLFGLGRKYGRLRFRGCHLRILEHRLKRRHKRNREQRSRRETSILILILILTYCNIDTLRWVTASHLSSTNRMEAPSASEPLQLPLTPSYTHTTPSPFA